MTKTFYFATSNKGKFAEAKEKFRAAGMKLKRKPVELLEIQSDDVKEIVRISALELTKTFKKPFYVEDTAFFINALNGFPGTYAKHVYFTIGLRNVLKLMQGAKNRNARFETAIAFRDGNREKVFKGICRGNVTHSVQGTQGWGYDPIFVPEGDRKTFASDPRLKQRVSARALALQKLISYLKRAY
ncbi:TPA: RdgB/HAM1 family non-canonical purine NTP pyrophosphatase [archaeon]|uniref:RdgB/HAM1 family non-canonical purine NTP pyrophosphatase n=1 Tax=Candidatus Naiadarchaeum limnaeum TaxID=2756139 RepID=A0A832V241_9ARCH|nr:RdgB/HAM1 family non-canonical purine NTP pyrophosphatase [Candidatus Naiadarchaeum limnaeum]